MVLSVAEKVQRFRLPVSVLQALSLLMIGIIGLTFCFPVQMVEADGWDKIKAGLGLIGAGVGVAVVVVTAPVSVPVTVTYVGAAAAGALIGGGILGVSFGAAEETLESSS